ncbi:MAG TPA: alpha-L-fucosidase [Terriglobia bacterium]|nr:alpha-L-fucosidase [Terriglobia bacterium]
MRNQHHHLSIAGSAGNRICAFSRARFVLGALGLFLFATMAGFMLPAATTAQNFVDLKPTPQQLEWQDLEFGVIVHFGLNTFTDKEWGSGKVSPIVFNPTKFDPNQWVEAAKAAGAKYLVFVTKHHDGFCLFPTPLTKYSVASSPWENGHGDVVRAVEEACRRHGLKFGVYLSPWDRHEPSYSDNKAYDKFYEGLMEELLSRYGPIEEFWLDGAGSEGHVYDFEDYLHQLRVYQPNTLVFADVGFMKWGDIRWVGNEDGFAPDENWDVIDRGGYLRWRPAECDTPLHKLHWFWHPNDAQTLKTVPELMQIYDNSIGHGCQLMLGIAPDEQGLLPALDAARLREFGQEIRTIYAHNLAPEGTPWASAGGDPQAAFDNNPGTFWMAPPHTYQASLEVKFSSPVTFDRTVTMEWLNRGQNVEGYEVQAYVGNKWQTLHRGTSIGHKVIDIFPSTTSDRVRLVILGASHTPAIREFQIYNGHGAP